MTTFNTCFGLVTSTVEVIENADISTGKLAGMRVRYTFNNPNQVAPACAMLQCFDQNATNQGFALCQVGNITANSITVYVNRTDMIDDWNTPVKFFMSYLYGL